MDWARGTYWYLFGRKSSFCTESSSPPARQELDQTEKDKVLAQGKLCLGQGNAGAVGDEFM